MKAVLVLAALLGTGATAVVSNSEPRESNKIVWRQLIERDVSTYADAANGGPLDGAPGASAIGFRVNNDVQGGVIIVGIDRPALGVFVGLNTPNEFIDAPYEDLRVEFTLVDGTTHRVAPAGGGGTSMLFHSPDGVAVAALRKVALYVNDSAEWAQ